MTNEEIRQRFEQAVENKNEDEAILFGNELFYDDPIHITVGLKKLSAEGMEFATFMYSVFTLKIAKAMRADSAHAESARNMNLNELNEAVQRLSKVIENPEFEFLAEAKETYNGIFEEIICWDKIGREPETQGAEAKLNTAAPKLERAKKTIRSFLHLS